MRERPAGLGGCDRPSPRLSRAGCGACTDRGRSGVLARGAVGSGCGGRCWRPASRCWRLDDRRVSRHVGGQRNDRPLVGRNGPCLIRRNHSSLIQPNRSPIIRHGNRDQPRRGGQRRSSHAGGCAWSERSGPYRNPGWRSGRPAPRNRFRLRARRRGRSCRRRGGLRGRPASELGEPGLQLLNPLTGFGGLLAQVRGLARLGEIQQDEDRQPDDRRETGVRPD